jgi:NitT/TauT family transport system substrate-binding protein
MLTLPRAIAGSMTLALALTTTACSTSATAVSTASLEKTNIVVALPHIIQSSAVFLAIKHGFFAQQGLHVKVVFDTASTQKSILAGMQNGSVDVNAGANFVSFFQLQAEHKMDIKALMDAQDCDAGSNVVLALPGSGINTPRDLIGKRVAVQLNPNIQTLSLNELLEAQGLNPALVQYKDITFPLMVAALKAHKVDAISVVEPFISQAEAQLGAREVMTQCTGPVANLPQAGYIVTAAWASKYPHTAAAFQRAIIEAQQLAATDRAAVEQILPTYIQNLPPTLTSMVDLGIIPTSINATQLQRIANLMLSGSLLHSPLQVAPLIFNGP